MRIKKLTLQTHKLEEEKTFYGTTLGFNIVHQDQHSFTVKIGWSQLTFQRSDVQYRYHYCFLIPRNQLPAALAWMQQRTSILDIEPGQKTVHFDSWNADSFYFYDASGNIAEMIVRNGLDLESDKPFDINNVLCVNEIGTPTTDIATTQSYLRSETGLNVWKGNVTRFSTVGSEEGLFLLPNHEVKTTWFPTNDAIIPAPYQALIDVDNTLYTIKYNNAEINAAIVEPVQ